jgi:hypothetical protein
MCCGWCSDANEFQSARTTGRRNVRSCRCRSADRHIGYRSTPEQFNTVVVDRKFALSQCQKYFASTVETSVRHGLKINNLALIHSRPTLGFPTCRKPNDAP